MGLPAVGLLRLRPVFLQSSDLFYLLSGSPCSVRVWRKAAKDGKGVDAWQVAACQVHMPLSTRQLSI